MNENPLLDSSLEDALKQEAMMASIMEALEEFETDLAQELLDSYEESYGEDEFWHIVSIDIAEQQSDPESMLDAIHTAQNFGIDDDELALRYGRFCYMIGHPEEALEYLKECNFEEDTDQEFYKTHLEAYCSLIAQDYPAAVDKLEDLLLDTDDYRIVILAALCYKELGKEERAREYLAKGLESRDDFAPEYAELLGKYHYDPDEILRHTRPLFDGLAGTRSNDSQSDMVAEVLEAMAWLESREEVTDDFYLRFGSYLDQEPENPVIAALQAVYHLHTGNSGRARTAWRKALVAPWENDEKQDVIFLFFRLMALDALDYSTQTAFKHLRKMWNEQPVAMLRMELMMYATYHGFKGLLTMMVKEANRPVMQSRAEECAYDLARAKAYIELERFGKASDLIYALWDEMHENTEYLVLASGMAVIVHDQDLLIRTARILMPHGIAAFHLLEFYDMEENTDACMQVQEAMKRALDNPDIEVPEADFYIDYLKAHQQHQKN